MKTSAKRTRRILALFGIILVALLLWSSCSRTPAAAPVVEPVAVPEAPAPEPNPCDSPDLPAVVWTDGTPELKPPASPAPTEMKVIECRKGTGELFTGEEGSTAYLRYTVGTWDENRTWNKTLDTEWNAISIVPVTNMNPLYLDVMKGKRAGSQVLVVAPPGDISEQPDDAYFTKHTMVYLVELMPESALNEPEALPSNSAGE